jgi:hypothetical protein
LGRFVELTIKNTSQTPAYEFSLRTLALLQKNPSDSIGEDRKHINETEAGIYGFLGAGAEKKPSYFHPLQ